MRASLSTRHAVVVLVLVVVAARASTLALPALAQPPREEFTNLKVLPKDIAPQDLRSTMNGFTRALGVRCIHCHVGEEGKPFRHEDFAKDDKPTKRKAREMMRMTQDLNDKYLASLADRADPPVRIQCVTCHHGVPQPRTLQDVLGAAYEQGGIDSTLARYQALRDRYYGRFSYDFGDVPLADVAAKLWAGGHTADAERLLAMNVERNPASAFAKRQHAIAVLVREFAAGRDSGAAAYRDLKQRYGPALSEEAVNAVGYDLLGAGQTDAAVAAFRLNAAEHPSSSNAFDSLGEAYLKTGDRTQAISAYQKALELDEHNENAARQLAELKAKPLPGR